VSVGAGPTGSHPVHRAYSGPRRHEGVRRGSVRASTNDLVASVIEESAASVHATRIRFWVIPRSLVTSDILSQS
jgi:hypothetical protein